MSGKEYTAKSVEEALEKALNEMFLTREDIDYEVVQQPSKGFLGFGQKDAVVRVSKKVIDEVKETAKIETVKEEKAEPAVDVYVIALVAGLTFLIGVAGFYTMALQTLICVITGAFCNLLWGRLINYLYLWASKDKYKYFHFVREDDDDE